MCNISETWGLETANEVLIQLLFEGGGGAHMDHCNLLSRMKTYMCGVFLRCRKQRIPASDIECVNKLNGCEPLNS